MDETVATLSQFFITLPSTASSKFFPENTQSCYKTKLSSPLVLNGNWECGLSEIFIPRSWFNVDQHNNYYTVNKFVEETVLQDSLTHEIKFTYELGDNIHNFCENLDYAILEGAAPTRIAKCHVNDEGLIAFEIDEGYEIHVLKEKAPKLLYMLNLPNEDLIIRQRRSIYTFRPTKQAPKEQVFTVWNKNVKNIEEYTIQITSPEPGLFMQAGKALVGNLNKNIRMLNLQHVLQFTYDSERRKMNINIGANAELRMSKITSPTFMAKISLSEDVILRGSHELRFKPLGLVEEGETLVLAIKEPHEIKEVKKKSETISLNVGRYENVESFFGAFKHIRLSQLPNSVVAMQVSPSHEVVLGRGLADMLGFDETTFGEGLHVGKYALQLNAGITEIFVYTDIVASHHVGDSFVRLLRVIPCMQENDDKIVKLYQRPLYFPVSKTYIESIEIELRSSFGSRITFMGGKTHVVLSFRRTKL